MENIEDLYAIYSVNPMKKLKVNETLYTNNNIEYKILNYDRETMSDNVSDITKLYRSIVFSSPENELLSFSPQKTINREEFIRKYNVTCDDIYINEYIDGTLIHLFYDDRIKQWEISTKSAVGGNYKLYNSYSKIKTSKNVKDMFLDAITRNIYSKTNSISNNTTINNFFKNYCYTFVLSHPDNPIVFPITQPKIYLTNVFDIIPKKGRVINIPPYVYQQWDIFQNTCILFPSTKQFDTWDSLTPERLIHLNNNEENCGYMATHIPSGQRCKFYNGRYKELLRLKTIKSQFLLRYICLRRANLLNDYLVQNPGERKRFRLFKDLFQSFINNLHAGYLTKYVWKAQTEIDNKFAKYIDEIHKEVYIPNIRSNIKITKKTVYDFVIRKHPGELLQVLISNKN